MRIAVLCLSAGLLLAGCATSTPVRGRLAMVSVAPPDGGRCDFEHQTRPDFSGISSRYDENRSLLPLRASRAWAYSVPSVQLSQRPTVGAPLCLSILRFGRLFPTDVVSVIGFELTSVDDATVRLTPRYARSERTVLKGNPGRLRHQVAFAGRQGLDPAAPPAGQARFELLSTVQGEPSTEMQSPPVDLIWPAHQLAQRWAVVIVDSPADIAAPELPDTLVMSQLAWRHTQFNGPDEQIRRLPIGP
jgi:hypothetical protein